MERILDEKSISEFSQETHVSHPTVSRWLAGAEPNPNAVVRVCRTYGISPIEGLVAAGVLREDEVGKNAPAINKHAVETADFPELIRAISYKYSELEERYRSILRGGGTSEARSRIEEINERLRR